MESIVVGTDGSETAREAVRQAGDLAKTIGARVHVVSAYEPATGVHIAGSGRKGGLSRRSGRSTRTSRWTRCWPKPPAYCTTTGSRGRHPCTQGRCGGRDPRRRRRGERRPDRRRQQGHEGRETVPARKRPGQDLASRPLQRVDHPHDVSDLRTRARIPEGNRRPCVDASKGSASAPPTCVPSCPTSTVRNFVWVDRPVAEEDLPQLLDEAEALHGTRRSCAPQDRVRRRRKRLSRRRAARTIGLARSGRPRDGLPRARDASPGPLEVEEVEPDALRQASAAAYREHPDVQDEETVQHLLTADELIGSGHERTLFRVARGRRGGVLLPSLLGRRDSADRKRRDPAGVSEARLRGGGGVEGARGRASSRMA